MKTFLIIVIIVCLGLLVNNIQIPECPWCKTDVSVYPESMFGGDWRCHKCDRLLE